MPISDSVKLGRDVKIFHPSLVNLYGCTIGDGALVGLGSNVIHSVAQGSTVAGNPARATR
jgi:acetyltransferase-like isoleucine patch superfamily enzyme